MQRSARDGGEETRQQTDAEDEDRRVRRRVLVARPQDVLHPAFEINAARHFFPKNCKINMSQTSALLVDVWGSTPSSPKRPPPDRAVSARVVAPPPLPQPIDVGALYDEMTHRTHLFVAILVLVTALFTRRLRRLEKRITLHKMGVHTPHLWW